MGIVETTGIITREVKYGDSSRILTVITRDFGKISVLAGGARSNRSGLLSSTQLFTYGEFTLFKGREKSLYKINNVSALESFSPLRNSLEKMAYASYFCEVANTVVQEESPDEEQMTLLLNALFMLSADKCPDKKVKGVFEMRTLAIQGFLSVADGCMGCDGGGEPVFFDPRNNKTLCRACGEKNPEGLIEAGAAVLSAMSYITQAEPKKIFAFNLSDNAISYLSRLGEYCLELHTEKHFKTLDYLKSVMELEG